MPPVLALFVAVVAIIWLLRQDARTGSSGTRLMLVAAFFLTVIASRPLPYWFGGIGGDAEGSPINTAFFAGIIVVALFALNTRKLSWGSLIAQNKAVFLLYGFFALSSGWSADGSTSVKRLLKDFVCLLVALLLLSEADPARTCRRVFVRIACILFPLSLVFGKYFPAIGRGYSMGGEPMFTGVTTQKNSLGEIAFVFGVILLWDLAEAVHQGAWRHDRRRVAIESAVLALGLWLLAACDSKTSLVCLLIAGSLLLARPWFLRRQQGKPLLGVLLAAALAAFALDNAFGFSETLFKALNRNPTLTGRTDIWRVVLEQQHEPLLGGGFYAFWDGEKGRAVAKTLAALNSAHSGYVETYLDGGIVGCVVLGLFLLAAGKRAFGLYFSARPFASIALPFWIAALVYNLSEASFLRLDPLWFTLLLVVLDPPSAMRVGAAAPTDSAAASDSTRDPVDAFGATEAEAPEETSAAFFRAADQFSVNPAAPVGFPLDRSVLSRTVGSSRA